MYKLSGVYPKTFYVVGYFTGFEDEIELINKTFTTKGEAIQYAKNSAYGYVAGKLMVIEVNNFKPIKIVNKDWTIEEIK